MLFKNARTPNPLPASVGCKKKFLTAWLAIWEKRALRGHPA
jgi:hypothetical protein